MRLFLPKLTGKCFYLFCIKFFSSDDKATQFNKGFVCQYGIVQ